jgi:hypothetical protein
MQTGSEFQAASDRSFNVIELGSQKLLIIRSPALLFVLRSWKFSVYMLDSEV